MFELRWAPETRARLRQFVEAAADPGAVIAAVQGLDRLLRDDPAGHSESRPDAERIAFARPLGVRFRVEGQYVVIGAVWRIRPT